MASGSGEFYGSIEPYISRLTLRVAGGYTGNVVQGVYKQLVIKYGSSYWNGEKTGSIDKAPNPRLRWEKTRDMKVALDFGLFGDRVSGLVEGYYRKVLILFLIRLFQVQPDSNRLFIRI